MSGLVFHHISEGVMAQNLKLDVNDARDTLSIMVPDVKGGDLLAANYVLNQLGVKTNTNKSDISTQKGVIPNVIGMGSINWRVEG